MRKLNVQPSVPPAIDTAAAVRSVCEALGDTEQFVLKLSLIDEIKSDIVARIAACGAHRTKLILDARSKQDLDGSVVAAYEDLRTLVNEAITLLGYDANARYKTLKANHRAFVRETLPLVAARLLSASEQTFQANRMPAHEALKRLRVVGDDYSAIMPCILSLETATKEHRWGDPRHHTVAIAAALIIMLIGIPATIWAEHWARNLPFENPIAAHASTPADVPSIIPKPKPTGHAVSKVRRHRHSKNAVTGNRVHENGHLGPPIE
jgi:hypothetical protein